MLRNTSVDYNKIYLKRVKKNIFKVRKEQRLLLNSINAKLLAVKKCTQDNRGKMLELTGSKLFLPKNELS